MIAFTQTLSDWISDSTPINDERLLTLARHGLTDTVGGMLAGANDPVVQQVFRSASRWGGGEGTVVGRTKKLPQPQAALVNATAAHALDYDDNYLVAITHPSAVMIPALLAIGEQTNASGSELLDAYIVGLEAQKRIGRLMNPQHYERGWHATSTIGLLGAVAGCARLLKLPAEKINAALSIGVSMAFGSKIQFGTAVKPLHAGMAAERAVIATYMALDGLTGSKEPIVGTWSFCDLFAGHQEPDIEQALDKLGEHPFGIEEPGLLPKRFPCCGSIHFTLDSIEHLLRKHSFSLEEIEKIETTVVKRFYDNLRYTKPKTGAEARFSMHYSVACFLEKGSLSLNDFEDRAVQNENVLSWIDRIEMNTLEKPDDKKHVEQTRIVLKNGTVHEHSTRTLYGSVKNPFQEKDRKEKFMDCAGGRTLDQAGSLYNLLSSLDDQTSITDITRFFYVFSGSARQ